MSTARVYFWDGYRFGPMIETVVTDLEERLRQVVDMERPDQATAMFVAQSLAHGHSAGVWNAAPARTVGQMYTSALAEANWPGMAHPKDWRAGVFILDLKSGECSIIGGRGFGLVEENPRQLRTAKIHSPKEEEEDAET